MIKNIKIGMNIHKILISQQDAGTRLSKLINKYFATVPFTTIAKLVRTGQIRLNGKRSTLNAKLEKDDEVRIPIHESTIMKNVDNIDRKFSELEKKIAAELVESLIYKDENILVLNKPAGLAVQGGSKIKISIDSLSILLQFEANEKPRLVHRLDKETSGILLLARNKQAAQTLSLALKEQNIQKRYIAILDGIPEITEDVINIPIKKSRLQCRQFEKVQEDSEGKNAVTEYRVLDCINNSKIRLSLVEFLLITGRTHQIRVHSSSIGCPVLGDEKYVKNKANKKNPLFLHAWQIQLSLFGKNLKLTAQLPDYFTTKLKSLNMKLSYK